MIHLSISKLNTRKSLLKLRLTCIIYTEINDGKMRDLHAE